MTHDLPRRAPRARALFGGACVAALLLSSAPTLGQRGLTLPPSGGNQKSSVVQHIGPVEVRIDYSSPDVTGPQGQDRRGQIWGQLVPYGLTNLGFGTSQAAPWRAGANENTVFSVSHDVKIGGETLAAGRYGLHMIAQPEGQDWTVIFSKNSTSWGSFFYDPAEDALRVSVTPEKAEFREWLTYDFTDRQADRATVALRWEEVSVPFEIEVPDVTALYLTQIRKELRDSPGFTWQNWNTAAQYCLQNQTNLEEALTWAETAISAQFVGQENFTTLLTKAQVLQALQRADDAQKTLTRAIDHATATPTGVHTVARTLQAQGQTDAAVAIFKKNAERFGEQWPVHVGLARAHSAEGNYAKALEHAKKAHAQAPDQLNKGNLETVISILEEGRDFNPTN